MKYLLRLFTLLLAATAGMGTQAMATTEIVYIEASTGNRWKLEEFPQRVGLDDYHIEFHALYQFDKSPALQEVLARGDKPDVVVLQECSVYFPGPLDQYQARLHGWIEQLRAAGIQPVVATTVPPASSLGWWQDFKDFIKVRVLGRESQHAQVVAFNRWLRNLAESENLPLLDLEAATRVSDENRHLRPAFNAGDGIHLNQRAYQELDGLFRNFLRSNPRLSGEVEGRSA